MEENKDYCQTCGKDNRKTGICYDICRESQGDWTNEEYCNFCPECGKCHN